MENKKEFDDKDAEIILLSLPFIEIPDFLRFITSNSVIYKTFNKFPEHLLYYVNYMKQNLDSCHIKPNVLSIKSTYLKYINYHVKLFQEYQLKERENVDAYSLLEEITKHNSNFNHHIQHVQSNCLGFDPLVINIFEKFPSTVGFIFILEKMIYYNKTINNVISNTTQHRIIEFYKGQFEHVLEALISKATSSLFNIFKIGSMGKNLEVSYSAWGRHNPIGFRLRDLRHSTVFSLEGFCLRFEEELAFLPKLSKKFPVDIWTSNVNDENEEENHDNNNGGGGGGGGGVLTNAKSFIEFLEILHKETLPTCVAGPSIRVS